MVFCFHRIPTELQFECKAIIKKIFNQIFVSEFLNKLGHTACSWHMLLHETKEQKKSNAMKAH